MLARIFKTRYGDDQVHLNIGKEHFPWTWADGDPTMSLPWQ